MSEWQELDWDRARELAGSICDQLASEVLPLENTIDRFLGQDYMALCDLPTFTTSSMDGWAVAGKGPWKIVGDVKAGAPYEKGLESGTTVRIATGAVIPQGICPRPGKCRSRHSTCRRRVP
jgi:molybdopterin molybdotransferase